MHMTIDKAAREDRRGDQPAIKAGQAELPAAGQNPTRTIIPSTKKEATLEPDAMKAAEAAVPGIEHIGERVLCGKNAAHSQSKVASQEEA